MASPTPTAPPTTGAVGGSTPASGLSSGSPGAFVTTGIASAIDTSAASIDASTLGTSFPPNTDTLYAVFELRAGLTGPVGIIWTSASGKTFNNSQTYPAGGPWAWFGLKVAAGLAPGPNQARITFEPTGEGVTLAFAITTVPATASPSSAASAGSAFTLIRLATAADTSRPAPDPSTFTTSYSPSSPAFYIIFELRAGLTGTVTATLTKDGAPVLAAPLSIDYQPPAGWGNFKIASGGQWPTGDYVATLTYVPTGATATITITVK